MKFEKESAERFSRVPIFGNRSSTVSIKGTISARNGSDEPTSWLYLLFYTSRRSIKPGASRYRSCLLTEFIFDAVSLHADIHHAPTNFHARLLFPSAFFTATMFFQASTRSIDRIGNGSILISFFSII